MMIERPIGKVIKQPVNRLSFIDYQLFNDSLSNFPDQERNIINTINSHSFCIAEKDNVFKESLKHSDILLPDGAGIVLALQLLYRKKIKKISGMDMFYFLLNRYRTSNNPKERRVFFLGSSVKTLELIKKKMDDRFPEFEVQTYSPPFKDSFDENDNAKIIESIERFNPYILFVGMTAPKQEKWVYLNKKYLSATHICSIGAVFDFFAETTKRPGEFWIRNNLEWFARFIKEPRRLWYRALISTPHFIIKMINYKFTKI